MTFKQDYLQNKAANWKNHDRNLLAEREYKTISYLLQLFYNFELKKGSSILDLGSGDQFLRNEFSKREISYFSLDINDLDFENDKFNFKDDKFDLVISLAVLEHLKNPDLFLNESRRVLKNESFLFLSTVNWKYSKNIFYDDVTHVKPYSPESLNEVLSMKD